MPADLTSVTSPPYRLKGHSQLRQVFVLIVMRPETGAILSHTPTTVLPTRGHTAPREQPPREVKEPVHREPIPITRQGIPTPVLIHYTRSACHFLARNFCHFDIDAERPHGAVAPAPQIETPVRRVQLPHPRFSHWLLVACLW